MNLKKMLKKFLYLDLYDEFFKIFGGTLHIRYTSKEFEGAVHDIAIAIDKDDYDTAEYLLDAAERKWEKILYRF
jgi:hypothetical protein